MKRKLLTLILFALLFCFAFAVSAFAAKEITGVTHTYYVVASQDSDVALGLQAEGKETIVLSEVYGATNNNAPSEGDWVTQFEDGAHVELIFAENIIESVGDNTGILLAGKITVTVRYNGFCHLVTNGGRVNVFVLKHSGAQINLIGSTDIYGEDGKVDPKTDFVYNTSDLSKNTVQIYHGKVYCWVYDGNVYAENIRTLTGEEFVYSEDDNSTADGNIENTYEFVDCAAKSNSASIGLLGKDSATKKVLITNGYYSQVKAYTLLSGTTFKDCTIDAFVMDCWDIENQFADFRNCTLGSIITSSGRTHLRFYDCEFDIAKLSLGSDGGGACYALVYTSPSCTEDGTLNVYKYNNGTTPVNSKDNPEGDSKYAATVTEYYANPDNKAKGHTFSSWAFEFAGAMYMSACTATRSCEVCEGTENEEIASMFAKHGYSVPTYPTAEASIYLGFNINRDAITKYEELSGSKFSFGVLAAAEDRIGTGVAPLDQNGEPIERAIALDMTEYTGYAIFGIKIGGISDQYKDEPLLMAGYVIEDKQNGESLSIYYLQNKDELVTPETFEYVTFNQLYSELAE